VVTVAFGALVLLALTTTPSPVTHRAAWRLTPSPSPTLTPPPSPTPSPNETVRPAALGAFLGSDASGVQAIARFAGWLGAPVTVGHTYLPGQHWDDLEGADWVLDPWSQWRRADPGRLFVLNVPMVAPNEPPLSDGASAILLRRGAGGAYNDHFRTLAQRLIDRGVGDAIIVLGWEMNGTTYTDRCGPDPSAWRRYWRRIVATMRSVPGEQFRFDFAPVRGVHQVPWQRCYPGDDVVDIIGMDSYDQHPGRSFHDFVHQTDGLLDHAQFAKEHGKPMSFPEWGLYDYGDDPSYIRAMYAWIAAHNVVYQTITDYCPHGVWDCHQNPASSRVYRQLFGQRSGP
jgi:hypothetical protein